MFNVNIRKDVIEPAKLTERQKIEYLAGMHYGDIYPTAFRADSELSLISMLARRVLELEERIEALGEELDR